jgi:hypothetical protein
MRNCEEYCLVGSDLFSPEVRARRFLPHIGTYLQNYMTLHAMRQQPYFPNLCISKLTYFNRYHFGRANERPSRGSKRSPTVTCP